MDSTDTFEMLAYLEQISVQLKRIADAMDGDDEKCQETLT